MDRIDGVPPAIAIDQTNPVRTSRSTVGTMTEITDHLKLLFARSAELFCPGCGERVQRDTVDGIVTLALAQPSGQRLAVVFTRETQSPWRMSSSNNGYRHKVHQIYRREANSLHVMATDSSSTTAWRDPSRRGDRDRHALRPRSMPTGPASQGRSQKDQLLQFPAPCLAQPADFLQGAQAGPLLFNSPSAPARPAEALGE